MNKSIYSKWDAFKYKDGSIHRFSDSIVTELPVTIMVNGEELATIVCSPTNIDELATGFLAAEGIIRSYGEIRSLKTDAERGFVYIELTKQLDATMFDLSKRFIGSCCGKSRQFYFKSDVQTARTVSHSLSMTAAECLTLMDHLQEESQHFKKTGGVHNAALATKNQLLKIRTDIGRHNTLDKLYGYMITEQIPAHDKVIVFSGRISSEVLLKISKMGIGMLISTSAPTNLALQLATDLRITTVGFARGTSLNVYTCPERITDAQPSEETTET